MKPKPGHRHRHRVVIYVYPDADQKTMTERQAKKWVEGHFDGCDYGEVKVADVLNEQAPSPSKVR